MGGGELAVCAESRRFLRPFAILLLGVIVLFPHTEAREVPWTYHEAGPHSELLWLPWNRLDAFGVLEREASSQGIFIYGGGLECKKLWHLFPKEVGLPDIVEARSFCGTRDYRITPDYFTANGYAHHSYDAFCGTDVVSLDKLRQRAVTLVWNGYLVYKERTACEFSPPELPTINRFTAGDLTGDGQEDVIGSFSDGRLVWWEQPRDPETSGTWVQWPLESSYLVVVDFFMADIDGDGDEDIVHISHDPEAGQTVLRWLENDDSSGIRIFRDRPIDIISGTPTLVERIDFDRDGDFDIVSSSGFWWENAGSDGLLWEYRGNILPETIIGLEFADIDQDGDSDIVSHSVWWENLGGDVPYTWQSHVLPIPEGQSPSQIELFDFEQDGDLDILYLSGGSMYALENGLPADTIAFIEKRIIASDFDQGNDVLISDLDRDGDPDVIAAAWWDDAVRMWKNDGAFIPGWTVSPIDNDVDGARSIAIADVDDDAWPDLIGATEGLDSVLWWSNQNGVWTRDVIETVDASRDVAVFDFEGDHDLDVVAAVTADDAITLWTNDGTPRYSEWLMNAITPGGSLSGVWDVVAGDLDRDGDTDLVASAEEDGEIKWYENVIISDARVMYPHDLADGIDGIRGIELADVDGDHDLDVVGAVSSLDLIMWWENTTGSPIYWETHFVGSGFEGSIDVIARDMDGDFDLDIVGAAQTAGAIRWWENTAGDAIHWDEHTITNDFPDVRSIAVADLDRNGALDVVAIAGRPTNEIAWWPNRPQPWRGAVVPSPQRFLLPDVATEIFNVEVSHSGEPTEPALIIDTWQLRIERAGGYALSQTELEQLVKSFSVYEDDGDGRFGPEDFLVFEESELTINPDGMVAVLPPSLQPLPQVEPGDSGRFYLILTPTLEAHQSGLDELILTPVDDLLVHPADSERTIPLADMLAGEGLSMRVRESAYDFAADTLVAPAEVVTEHAYEVTWKTLDPRPELVAWRDRVYVSRDPYYQKDSDDFPVATHDWLGTAEAEAAGFTKTETFIAPELPPGNYYLVVNLDDKEHLEDADYTNNQHAVPIHLLAPDLVPHNLQAPPEWGTQQEVTLTWDVENIGDGESLKWRDEVYLSPEPTIEAAVEVLDKTYEHDTLAVGTTAESSLIVTVPEVPQGFYYVILENNDNGNGWVYEYSKWDQTLMLPVTILNPDLRATEFTFPRAIVAGAPIEMDWTVANDGLSDSIFALDGIYLSEDGEINAGDELLTWAIAPGISPGETYNFYDTYRQSHNFSPGVYSLILKVDYQTDVFESNEVNNLVARPFEIADPEVPRPVSSAELLPGPSGSLLCMTVFSALGQSFGIEATTDLAAGSWTPIPMYTTPDGTASVTEIGGTGFNIPVYVEIPELPIFFRVRVAD